MEDRSSPSAKLLVTQRNDAAGGSHLAGTASHYFICGEHTGGAFSLTEILFGIGAQGTPMHVHTREDETYYVLEGELLICVGGEDLVLGPGGSVVLPRDIRHKVTPAPGKVTRALMIVTPPGLENMLMELDKSEQGKLDIAALVALSDDYGIRLLPDDRD